MPRKHLSPMRRLLLGAVPLLFWGRMAVAQDAPVPPGVEQAPIPVEGGGYCFAGPHPTDPQVEPGPDWDPTVGPHTHAYPPMDQRLFAFKDGCYYFVGDPTDFGYQGQTYAYYGAHPVLDTYGGGWCFMIGAHAHWWRPWSPYFVTMGPWFYWDGPYDPFFWSYWPYYSYYYRAYYPRYYAGGRFYRGGGVGVAGRRLIAPPVGRVAAPPAGAVPATAVRGGFRGSTVVRPGADVRTLNGRGGWTGNAPTTGGFRAAPAAGFRTVSPPPSGGFRSAPSFGGAVHSAPSGGGFHGGGGFRHH